MGVSVFLTLWPQFGGFAARHVKLFAHFFQCVVGVHVNAETHPQNFGLLAVKPPAHFVSIHASPLWSPIQPGQYFSIFYEISQMRIFIISDGSFHGNRFLGDFQHLAHLVFGHFHALSNSSGVASRPSSCKICLEIRFNLLIVSIICTGIRIVRAWSAIERVMACLIHQVA